MTKLHAPSAQIHHL